MRRETAAGTEAGIRFSPANSEYYARLAFLVSNNDPRRAMAALRDAVARNPRDAGSWIEMGLMAEAEGDLTYAIRCLLHAAGVNRMFLPRWTLANYYFRHNDPAMFWHWSRQAAEMVYDDPQPLFRLCGRLAEDGMLIDRLDIRRPQVRAGYLSYLMDQNRVDLFGPAVRRVLESQRESDLLLLVAACERLLESGHVEEAVAVWNREADLGRLPFRTPAGTGEQLVANAAFSAPPASRGFDWRLAGTEGVAASLEDGGSGGLRLTFSGRQPEDCEVLAQLVPVQPKTRYQLRFRYRTQGITTAAGLQWRVLDGDTALKQASITAAEPETEDVVRFETPPRCRLVRVSLKYRRPLGSTRAEGFLVLRSVAMNPAPQLPIEGSRVR